MQLEDFPGRRSRYWQVWRTFDSYEGDAALCAHWEASCQALSGRIGSHRLLGLACCYVFINTEIGGIMG